MSGFHACSVNSSSEMEFPPLPKDNPPRRKPDLTKTKKLLCWEPKVRLKEGIEWMIRYFREEK